MNSPPPQNSLEAFANTAESVAGTRKKLEKAALLGEYLQQLTNEDLARAARYFAGQQFALNDARTTNVGGSILAAALCAATGVDPQSLGPRYARWGDGGDVAFEVFTEARPKNQPSLTLQETESLLAQLSATRGKNAKTDLLTEALSRATALEAKYLVKLLSGDLRIGLREGLVEDAIARAFEQPLAKVSLANMLRGDIGEAAVRARAAQGTSYLVQLPRDSQWQPQLADYWSKFGDRIGEPATPVAAPTALGDIKVRAVKIRPAVVSLISSADLNIVLQRLNLPANESFDVIIATNILVYYDVFEQSLALTNVEKMLRPGGFLLSNNALLELPGARMHSVNYETVVYSNRANDGDHIVWYQRAAN